MTTLNRTNRVVFDCLCISLATPLLFSALQIMNDNDKKWVGAQFVGPVLRQTLLEYSLPRPPRHQHVIFTPGRAVFAPNCFVELVLSLRLVPELLTRGGGGESVQTTSGIARNLEMSWAPRRAESTGRLTPRARQATHNARQTIAARHVIHGTHGRRT